MKIPRITNAPRIPQNRTRCCSCAGTANHDSATKNTKMLSTDRAFSTRYPVRNSSPRSWPNQRYTPRLKSRATEIHTADQARASPKRTSCALRWKIPISIAIIASTTTPNPSHRPGVPMVAKFVVIVCWDQSSGESSLMPASRRPQPYGLVSQRLRVWIARVGVAEANSRTRLDQDAFDISQIRNLRIDSQLMPFGDQRSDHVLRKPVRFVVHDIGKPL